MNKSGAVDVLLTVLGAYLLLQSLGGLRDPSFLAGVFVALPFGLLGALLIFVVYHRRKQRGLKKRQELEEMRRTPISGSVPVSIQIRRRPKAIKFLGIETAGGGILFLVIGLMSLILSQVIGIATADETLEQFREEVFGFLGPISDSPEVLKTFFLTFGSVYFALGGGLLVGAYGLLTGKKWAWGMAIILSASTITLDFAFVFLPMSIESSSGSAIQNVPIGMIFGVVMLYLLFRRDVRSYLGHEVPLY